MTEATASRSHEFGRAVLGIAATPISRPMAEAGAFVLLVPLLLSIAIWNGFPIIYYDTGAYLLEGVGRVFMAERSPVYSLFLDFAGAARSLWFVALVQAAAAAFVIVEAERVIAPRLSFAASLAIGLGLVVATGLPWYVGEIEPDCFAPLAVLSLYLLAFHRNGLAGWRYWTLGATATLAMAVHPSHVLLGVGLIAALALYRCALFLRANSAHAKNGIDIWPRARILAPTVCAALSVVLIVASNFTLTGKVFVSRAGPAFIFARMLQDGIVMRLLDDTCPQSHYRLCTYKEVLPRTADQWLWGRDSPFLEMGRFEGTSAESTRIIWDSVKRYPGLQVTSALTDTWRQFVRFRTGDQIEPQEWVLSRPLQQFIPGQMNAYLTARQQQGDIEFTTINWVDVTVAWLSLAGLVFVLFLSFRLRQRRNGLLLGFILLALAGNAAICGALSNPHDRYQSRLIWLPPFALLLIMGDRSIFALRRPGESGT